MSWLRPPKLGEVHEIWRGDVKRLGQSGVSDARDLVRHVRHGEGLESLSRRSQIPFEQLRQCFLAAERAHGRWRAKRWAVAVSGVCLVVLLVPALLQGLVPTQEEKQYSELLERYRVASEENDTLEMNRLAQELDNLLPDQAQAPAASISTHLHNLMLLRATVYDEAASRAFEAARDSAFVANLDSAEVRRERLRGTVSHRAFAASNSGNARLRTEAMLEALLAELQKNPNNALERRIEELLKYLQPGFRNTGRDALIAALEQLIADTYSQALDDLEEVRLATAQLQGGLTFLGERVERQIEYLREIRAQVALSHVEVAGDSLERLGLQMFDTLRVLTDSLNSIRRQQDVHAARDRERSSVVADTLSALQRSLRQAQDAVASMEDSLAAHRSWNDSAIAMVMDSLRSTHPSSDVATSGCGELNDRERAREQLQEHWSLLDGVDKAAVRLALEIDQEGGVLHPVAIGARAQELSADFYDAVKATVRTFSFGVEGVGPRCELHVIYER